jgi:pimeloyl-ACP methyl ester carboxylesterase
MRSILAVHARDVERALDEEVTVDIHEDPEFRWLEQGAGEPVLLLHGLLGQMRHWEPVLEAVQPGYRGMALTLPIFHPELREASVGGLARYVLQFMDALDIPRAVLGGNSLGGHVALRLALDHGDRVSGLVLTGSSGLFERGFTGGVPHRPHRSWVREKMQEVFYDPALVTDAWVADVHRLVTTPACALRILRLARDARRDNLESRLGEVRVPTLLVWGLEDRITPPAVGDRFRDLIRDAHLWHLSQCGHAPMLERPEAFAEVVLDWLDGTRSRREVVVPQLGGVR